MLARYVGACIVHDHYWYVQKNAHRLNTGARDKRLFK
jgi:hypothetical protein